MKKLLTIFSVIMAICISSPRAGVAVDACQPQSCTGGNEMINIISGQGNGSGLCFGCEEGDDDHECDGNAVVGQKDGNGYIKSVHVCDDGTFDNSWKDVSSSTGWCGATDIKPSKFESNANYKCVYSLDGTTIDYSSRTASLPSGGTPCKICKCEPGKIPNASEKDCIDDPAGQQACENAPSNGQWDGTQCLCGGDRTDGKGDNQKYAGADKKTCTCPAPTSEWDGSNCVDPNQSAIDNCRNSGGTWDTVAGKCVCIAAKGFDETPVNGQCVCKNSGEEYDGTRCVATEQAICTNSGGDWDGSTCTCDPAKHLKEKTGIIPARCECESNRYEYDNPPSKGCKLTAQAQRDDVLNNDCYNSGGVWQGQACVCDAADGLRTENNICVCLDDRYSRSKSNPRKCELTDIALAKQNCDDAHDGGENVSWIDAGKNSYCKCLDSSKDYDYKTKKCISYTEQWCNKIPGAHMMYGKCICKATQKAPVNGRCPTSGGGAGKSPAQADTTQIKKGIATKHDALATISNAWGRSHWKTASGNFNGARLASDSVAGVVLGTVGGVITSNVIKKNQVRGGFEDLRCVIGGQTVADWGDQFMVGVQ